MLLKLEVAQPTMPLTITVQSITGHSLEITLQPTANAAVLKSMVMGAMGMQDKSQIALYFAGEQLDPDSPRPLADFGLEEASVVRYVLRLRGGVFRARLPCRALITPAPNATNAHPHQSICIEVDFRESHDQLQLQLSGYQGSMRKLVLDRGPLMTLEAVDKLLSGLSLTVVQIRRALVRRTPDCVITRWNRAEALGAALVMREYGASSICTDCTRVCSSIALIVLDHLALSPEDFEAGEVVPVLCSVRSHALQTPGRFQLVATPPPPPRGPLFGLGWELNAHYRIDLCPDLNTLSAEKAMTHITTPSHYPYLEADAYGPLSRRNSGFDGLRRSWHFYRLHRNRLARTSTPTDSRAAWVETLTLNLSHEVGI